MLWRTFERQAYIPPKSGITDKQKHKKLPLKARRERYSVAGDPLPPEKDDGTLSTINISTKYLYTR